MNVGGAGFPGSYVLPASMAGTQRNGADADRIQAEQALQKRQVDQRELETRDADELLETQLSADRDVDGRLPCLMSLAEDDPRDETETPSSEGTGRGRDAFEERGRALDLDA